MAGRRKSDTQRGTKPEVVNRDVNAAQRASLAVQLRASKITYEEIAHRTGYANAGVCRKAIMRELDRTMVKNVEHLRSEELNTLDILQSECMTLFLDKDNKGRLFAADRILAIMERRAKLFGLDTPVDNAIAMNQIIVRETPQGWITQPAVEATTV